MLLIYGLIFLVITLSCLLYRCSTKKTPDEAETDAAVVEVKEAWKVFEKKSNLLGDKYGFSIFLTKGNDIMGVEKNFSPLKLSITKLNHKSY